MAPKIAVVSGKGGVGKSTVSVGLANVIADAGHDVLLIDADPQELATTSRWLDKANDPPDNLDWVRTGSTEGAIAEIAKTSAEEPDRWIVIDTPPRPEDYYLKMLAEAADLIVVPTSPSEGELEQATSAIATFAKPIGRRAIIVFTRVLPSAMGEAYAVREEAQAEGFEVAGGMMRYLVAVGRAAKAGQMPLQIPDPNAVADLRTVATELIVAASKRRT